MKNLRSMRGMSLIELIMLIAIGSVVVGGIVLFTRELTINSMKLKDRLEALDLAQDQMEAMMNTDFDHLTGVMLGDTVTMIGGFSVKQTVTLSNFAMVSTTDSTEPPSGFTGDYIVRLCKAEITVDYMTGNFANPLLKLTAYRQSSVLSDKTLWS